jgi:hypothetical protein
MRVSDNGPLRKVVKVIRKSQLDIDLLLECGHEVQHAIPYCSAKSTKQLTPTQKRCRECKREEPKGDRTFWNGELTPCRKVFVRMASATSFPRFWGEHLLGKEVPAVEVRYGSYIFYLYDDDGSGWRKVTDGQGSPRWGHREVVVADKSSARPR